MRKPFLALTAWLMLAAPAIAAGALAVDDATLATPGGQLETFGRPVDGGWMQWIQPASQVVEGVQLALGTGQGGGTVFGQSLAVQGKTLFRPLETDGFGYGLAVGGNLGFGAGGGAAVEQLSAYVPVSQSLAGDRLLLHQNVGWAFEPEDGHFMIWGLGSELVVGEGLSALAELYGDTRTAPFVQAGVNYWVADEVFEVTCTYNYRLDGGEAFFTVGVGYYGGLFSTTP